MQLSDMQIAVVGLGYVGLPLAVEFGRKRSVVGFDINESRIKELENYQDNTLETTQKELKDAVHLSYSSNLEEAKSIQADRQAMAEKLQKDFETLSQEQVAEMQRDIQEKGQDLEFLAGKIQQAQEETAAKIFNETGPAMQKIIGELIAAKQIKVLLSKNESLLFSDPALDLTDDVTSMLDVAASEAASQSD